MATAKKDEMIEKKDDRVEIMIPKKSASEDDNLFVSVNGKNYLLPRGKKSKVPAFVAEEIYRSWAAQDKLDNTVQKMLKEAQQPL